MPYVRKRGNSYQAQVGQGDFRITKSFKTKKEAQIWGLKQEQNQEQDNQLSASTMKSVLQKYLDEVVPTTANPLKYKWEIEALKRVSWADIPFNRLKSSHLTEWRDERYLRCSKKTVHTNFVQFKTALRYAKEDAALELFRSISLKDVPQRFVPRLERDAEQRLLSAADTSKSRYLPHLIIFAIETAMRRGEMLKLEWMMVDLERHLIHLPAEITKTGLPRTIVMTERCEQALLAMRELNDNDKLVYRKNPLFKTNRGAMYCFPITIDGLRKTFGTARAAAGLDYLHWHDLRHEGCSRLFEKGLTVPEVQAISGHRTPEELSRYSHHSASSLQQKMRG